ncbi:MAG: class I SAM-dependent methyltransferase [Cytophagales bacterium]|nr:MAG: class I SAM-dependent methyltransferase [Cytophagales bacterium]
MMKKFVYAPQIYNPQSAEQVVPFIIDIFRLGDTSLTSVVDVGCGLGTWLHVFEKQGITNILGIDAPETNLSELYIRKEQFAARNLAEKITLDTKFDLAICLEVAEHLPENKADNIVSSLTNLADVLVFSAAIPSQGGQGHLNEQWHTYWQEKFEKYNFQFYDVLRPAFWQNEKVDWWYKQNMFLVINEEKISETFRQKIKDLPTFQHQKLVHPQLFTEVSNYLETIRSGKLGVKKTTSLLWKALKRFM